MKQPIALFFGTRPQVIKASVLREALTEVGPVVAVDSGQHYDYEMRQVHYDQLGVRPPDAFLGVGTGSHAEQTAGILTACEAWLRQHRPRLAIVIGDTNTTLACALAAAKLRIPIAHVEAGLRSVDRFMAEDINRRVVDAVSLWLFAPCARVAATLNQEHPLATVMNVGDISCDVLKRSLPLTPAAATIRGYNPEWSGRFVYATLHRAELVDVPELLATVIAGLNRSPLPVLLAAHPRTTAGLERAGLRLAHGVHMTQPVGYLESLTLSRSAAVVVTDSGGPQREAYWLGRPCLTVRAETEWIETVQCGANRLVPPDQGERLPQEIATAAANSGTGTWDQSAYGEGHTARQIAGVLAAA